MKLLFYAIYAIILLVICILMYQYSYNMVMGTAPIDDVNENQSMIDTLITTERFYYKFNDIVEDCNKQAYDVSVRDMCITLFIDFNKRMDGYFTNHTEAVETILYR